MRGRVSIKYFKYENFAFVLNSYMRIIGFGLVKVLIQERNSITPATTQATWLFQCSEDRDLE
ncbi:unnamed protein product [Moneuplotes crassus]|uniref:Uncharacterized protein n=1 Tax=Euplotes crassus TaxID=5936 RepID=A0AAD2D074_EUPCR|nr:unnamed protein product [Moneuplotes crassus]